MTPGGCGGSGSSMFALVFFAGKRAPTVDFRQPRHWRGAQECVNRGIDVVRRSASTATLASCADVGRWYFSRASALLQWNFVSCGIGVVRRTCRSRLAGEPGLSLAAAVSDQCVRQLGSGGSGASMLCAGIFRGQARSYSGFSSAAASAWCAGVRQPRHWRGAQECVNRGIGVVRRSASTAALASCAGPVGAGLLANPV